MEGIVPPHDLNAEAAVLSAVMLEPSRLDSIPGLQPEHFYAEAHRRIFEAALSLHAQGQPADVVQIGTRLKDTDRLAQVGGMEYLTRIISVAPATSRLDHYARTVREKASLRKLTAELQRIAARAYHGVTDVPAFLREAEGAVFGLTQQETGPTGPKHARDVVKGVVARVREAADHGRIVGIPTGYKSIDALTAGYHPGELVIIAGRPSMGKTSLVTNSLVRMAKADTKCAMFSFEMRDEDILLREQCGEAKVPMDCVRHGRIDVGQWARFAQASLELAKLPLWIVDKPVNVLGIRSEVRRMVSEHGVQVVAIDYIQLVPPTKRSDSREREVAEVSATLKAIAKECGVCMVALSQLNRNLESRPDKRPMMSDLRDSGSIEQDADLIAFVYRDSYYSKNSTDDSAEVIVAKNRNGPCDTVRLRFDRQFTRFEEE